MLIRTKDIPTLVSERSLAIVTGLTLAVIIALFVFVPMAQSDPVVYLGPNPSGGEGGVSLLEDLTDVDITGAVTDNILYRSGSGDWEDSNFTITKAGAAPGQILGFPVSASAVAPMGFTIDVSGAVGNHLVVSAPGVVTTEAPPVGGGSSVDWIRLHLEDGAGAGLAGPGSLGSNMDAHYFNDVSSTNRFVEGFVDVGAMTGSETTVTIELVVETHASATTGNLVWVASASSLAEGDNYDTLSSTDGFTIAMPAVRKFKKITFAIDVSADTVSGDYLIPWRIQASGFDASSTYLGIVGVLSAKMKVE